MDPNQAIMAKLKEREDALQKTLQQVLVSANNHKLLENQQEQLIGEVRGLRVALQLIGESVDGKRE